MHIVLLYLSAVEVAAHDIREVVSTGVEVVDSAEFKYRWHVAAKFLVIQVKSTDAAGTVAVHGGPVHLLTAEVVVSGIAEISASHIKDIDKNDPPGDPSY